MPGTALRLGPFVGGLSTQGDPTAIGDAELVECINFELDLDGALISRPPIQTTTDMSGTWTERIVLIGVAVFAASPYLIGANANGTYVFNGGVWSVITNAIQASSMVQYNDAVYLLAVPNGTHSLSKW